MTEKKYFINRLTGEQIREFLNYHFSEDASNKKSYNFFYSDIAGRKSIVVNASYENGRGFESFTLFDFDCFGEHVCTPWIRYLYKIFGQEYKDAYMEYVIHQAEFLFR